MLTGAFTWGKLEQAHGTKLTRPCGAFDSWCWWLVFGPLKQSLHEEKSSR